MISEIRPRRLICLTGFMGSGKSTAARLLARQIGWPHVDLDKRITDATGLSIPEIFSRMGEPEFRRIEHEQLARVVGESVESQKPRIVSLGGGTISQPQNLGAAARERRDARFGCSARSRSFCFAARRSPTVRFFATRRASAACIRSGCRLTNWPIIAWTAASSLRAWSNRFWRSEFSRG